MMEKHRCKLCFRNFMNGKALGGHMRSHVMKAKKKEEEKKQFFDFQSVHSNSSESSFSSESESSSEEEEVEEVKGQLSNYEMRGSPKQSTFIMDRESETESSKKKNPICRRSKRVRKSRNSDFNRFKINGFSQLKKSKYENEEKKNTSEDSSMVEVEPLSSISDITPEENVAHCLIMLSKDSWKRKEIENQEEENDYYSEDSDVGKVIKSSSSKVKGKYKCETCNKLFRSYQALGGHRASHKKIKVNTTATPPYTEAEVAEEKIHECPFCQRVFSSGQALGGHKRSHFVNGASRIRPIQESSRTGEGLDIDLNLPAPIDEDDEISQTTFSAVSDAEFVYPFKESS